MFYPVLATEGLKGCGGELRTSVRIYSVWGSFALPQDGLEFGGGLGGRFQDSGAILVGLMAVDSTILLPLSTIRERV